MAHPTRMCHLSLMWCPNVKEFVGVESGAAFRACRWHELFDEFTPDSFHPRLFSLSSLVDEATTIGELHEDQDAWMKHLKHVQNEIDERLQTGLERSICLPRASRDAGAVAQSGFGFEVVGIGVASSGSKGFMRGWKLG